MTPPTMDSTTMPGRRPHELSNHSADQLPAEIADAPAEGTVLVIGGGLAGPLAALAAAVAATRVIVIERDHYPDRPGFRPGTPQSRHAHLLLPSGHRNLEKLLPGILDELRAAGAIDVPMSGGAGALRWCGSRGWMADHRSKLRFYSCTRTLLDHIIRERVARNTTVQFVQGWEVTGLLGNAQQVTGARIRQRGRRDHIMNLNAQWVIDASGRSSALPRWLADLGCEPVPEETCDPGVSYISRLFDRPTADLGFGALYLQTQPGEPRTGAMLPVEGGKFIVSLGGMRNAEPTQRGEAGFAEMLSRLRDPALRTALQTAQPASDVFEFRPRPSRWRHFERSAPDNLIAIGDSVCSANPVYGQMMSVAAASAVALRTAVSRHGLTSAAARTANKDIAAAVKPAWLMSSSEDARFPDTIGGPSGALIRAQHRILDRMLVRATIDPHVTATFYEIMSLVASPAAIARPRVAASLLLGRRR